MKQNFHQGIVNVTLSLVLTTLGAGAARAQQAAAASGRVATRPVAEVLAQVGQSAGVIILADSTVQGRLPPPASPVTAENVEQQIAEYARALPAGTTWAKLYVPVPANGRRDGNIVADFAHALARVVGTVGRDTPVGTVEILGRRLATDKANETIAALNLKLVYLLTNPRAVSEGSIAANWSRMTPEQRELYAQQQSQRLLALDPASRVRMLRDMMLAREMSPQDAVMRAMMSQMSGSERIQLKQAVGEALGAGKEQFRGDK